MVYLVGAGMGDASLITLKGIECIKKADVIVYDRLASPALLNYADDGCLLIYAGKAAGKHYMAQEEINQTLVKYGEKKTVVRLKGGDPFVFGRGGEEVEELIKNGIDYELIPGVSSSYGAAEYAGIPVTHRGASASFHVITGHEKQGGDAVDYEALAKLDGTLVFLMGLGNAKAISESLIKNGKDGDTKTAIISNAGTEKQTDITGTLKKLPEMADKMCSPAVIVAGDVVGFQNKWFKPSGKKILATGTRHINNNIKKAFGEMPVTEIPLVKIKPINYDVFQATDLTVFTHIAFTSANGVEVFFDYHRKSGRDIRSLSGIKFAAVGNKTAATLADKGITADVVPEVHTVEALAKELEKEDNKNVLLICAENGAAKLQCAVLPLYRTETDYGKKELLNITAPDMDYIIFSSGSAARAYAEMSEIEAGAKFIAIGTETAKAASRCGIEIYKTAPRATAESVAETILGDESDD